MKELHNPASETAAAQMNRYALYVLVLLTLANLLNYMDRVAIGILMPFIKRDMSLSDTELGILVGLAFSFFYAVCGLPIARWADRGPRNRIVALAVAIWSLMTAISGAANNFWQLLFARMGVGAGEAGGMPPSQSLICDYIPPARRAGALAFHAFGATVGLMLGLTLAGVLAEVVGWRTTFLILGMPGLILALIIWTTLKEPVRGTLDPEPPPPAVNWSVSFRLLWRSDPFPWLVACGIFNGFVQSAFQLWWPSFLFRMFEQGAAAAGASLGVAYGIGTGVGLLVSGWWANRVARRTAHGPLFLAAAAAALSMPCVAATLFVPGFWVATFFIGTSAFFWAFSVGPVLGTLYSSVPANVRATAGALYIFFTAAVGQALGPFVVGVLSDQLMPHFGVEALRFALLAPVAALAVLAGLLYMSGNRLRARLAAA